MPEFEGIAIDNAFRASLPRKHAAYKRCGMVRIEVGFEPHPYEKALISQTHEDIRNRLHGHEFGRFKIVLKKPPHTQQITLQFLGDPESCDKAKRLLGIY
jgi:hypothetical protein